MKIFGISLKGYSFLWTIFFDDIYNWSRSYESEVRNITISQWIAVYTIYVEAKISSSKMKNSCATFFLKLVSFLWYSVWDLTYELATVRFVQLFLSETGVRGAETTKCKIHVLLIEWTIQKLL